MAAPVLARDLLEPVATQLDAQVAAVGGRRLTVVRGWDAVRWDAPEPAALRAAGAAWEWVALEVAPVSFWDLHVGVLAAGHADQPARPAVGLHWRPVLDGVVRPLALELATAEDLHFAQLSGEYQQALPARPSTPAETARMALDLALRVSAALPATAGGPPDPWQ